MRYWWKRWVCRVRGHRWAESPVPMMVREAAKLMRPDAVILGNRDCGRCGVSQLKLEVPEGGGRGESQNA